MTWPGWRCPAARGPGRFQVRTLRSGWCRRTAVACACRHLVLAHVWPRCHAARCPAARGPARGRARTRAGTRRAAVRSGAGAPGWPCPRMAGPVGRVRCPAGREASRPRSSEAVPPTGAVGRPPVLPAATKARRPGAAMRYRAGPDRTAGHPATLQRGPDSPGRRRHPIATRHQGSSRGRPLATLSSLVDAGNSGKAGVIHVSPD
jgi:hypothetical protein